MKQRLASMCYWIVALGFMLMTAGAWHLLVNTVWVRLCEQPPRTYTEAVATVSTLFVVQAIHSQRESS